jgi:hypothetical protein
VCVCVRVCVCACVRVCVCVAKRTQSMRVLQNVTLFCRGEKAKKEDLPR